MISERENVRSTPGAPEQTPAKKKPFTQFLVSHGMDDAYQLEGMKDAILETLRANPGRKIVLFTESADGDREKAERKRELVLRGMRPSDAQLAVMHDLPIQGENDPDATPVLLTKDIPKSQVDERYVRYHGFIGHSLRMIDDIAEQFPRRIVWIQETRGDEAKALSEAAEKAIKEKGVFYYTGMVFGEKKLERVKDFFTYMADSTRVREEESAPRIVDAMQDEDVVAGFGWMGNAHTGLSHALRADTEVTRVFPNKQDGLYTYDPISSLIRERRFDPQREITTDEVADSLKAVKKVQRRSGILFNLGEKLALSSGINLFYRGDMKARKEQSLSRQMQDKYRVLRKDKVMQKEASDEHGVVEEEADVSDTIVHIGEQTTYETDTLSQSPEPRVGEVSRSSISEQEAMHTDPALGHHSRMNKSK